MRVYTPRVKDVVHATDGACSWGRVYDAQVRIKGMNLNEKNPVL